MFVNDMTDKGVNIQHIQEIYTIQHQNEKEIQAKICRRFENFFFKGDICTAKGHMKRCSTWLIIRECKSKPQ